MPFADVVRAQSANSLGLMSTVSTSAWQPSKCQKMKLWSAPLRATREISPLPVDQ